MDLFYLIIIGFLVVLAAFDLWVGVSNDAVNFLNSAIGAKVAKFRTVLIVAAVGVFFGAISSNGMMDVARHGIMVPSHFTFEQAITVFLAVMVTDVIILDIFNNLGLPTSTTVSMVFELIGGTFAIACIKIAQDDSLQFTELLNAGSALKMIGAIFFSVLVAFILGSVVQWISRFAFTFKYKQHLKYGIAVFGGISMTIMFLFIFYQGLKSASFISASTREWVNANIVQFVAIVFVVSSIICEFLYLLKVNVLKIIVLFGTFSLALAFAGNDLVNFIGVPLAGLSAYQDYAANGVGQDTVYLMNSLESSATSPFIFLVIAATVMIFAMATSKKAKNVIKTSVDLSSQDEGDEMFGSSSVARGVVRISQNANDFFSRWMPQSWSNTLNRRFNTDDISLPTGAAFDEIRASVNLVISAILIILGTTQKLPLSTTYVTFMVAMGSSLADKAWGRENAVFRITGVLSVIGGWLLTAIIASSVCAIVAVIMYAGGFIAESIFMVIVVAILWQSNRRYQNKQNNKEKDDTFSLLMRTKDADLCWELLQKHVIQTQTTVLQQVIAAFTEIKEGFSRHSVDQLRKVRFRLNEEQKSLVRSRKREIVSIKRIPESLALERNTWYHLAINSALQYIYCLKRMLEPVKGHVENNFNPLPEIYWNEFEPVFQRTVLLLEQSHTCLVTGNYSGYRDIMVEGDELKDNLSQLRKSLIDRIQLSKDNHLTQVSIVYLNLLQECQQLLSIMRHQLRSCKKFTEKTDIIFVQEDK